jgi:hypothetical protein
VNKPWEAHPRDVAAVSIDPVKVPDGLGRLREVVRQEPAPVVPVEGPGEPPLVSREGPQVADLDHEKVARKSGLVLLVSHSDGAAQVVDLGQVDGLDVLGGVVVFDLSAWGRRLQDFRGDRENSEELLFVI